MAGSKRVPKWVDPPTDLGNGPLVSECTILDVLVVDAGKGAGESFPAAKGRQVAPATRSPGTSFFDMPSTIPAALARFVRVNRTPRTRGIPLRGEAYRGDLCR